MRADYSIWAFAYTHSDMPRDFFGGTLVESNRGMVRNPMVYTALHGGGREPRLILVDTGMKGGRSPSGKRYERVEHPDAILAKIGFAPEDVADVVLTHLHFDHAGNLDRFPNAVFHVQRREYDGWRRVLDEAGGAPDGGPSWPLSSINPNDFERLDALIGERRVRFLDGDAEIAPGVTARLAADSHTFGSQWVEVATSSGPHAVAGDCVYWYANIERMWPPAYVQGNAWNLLAAYRRISAAVGGTLSRVVPGHDPLLFDRHPSWTRGINPSAEVHLAAGSASRIGAEC